jgi:hypothetical protein
MRLPVWISSYSREALRAAVSGFETLAELPNVRFTRFSLDSRQSGTGQKLL